MTAGPIGFERLTAAQILGIPRSEPERLFAEDAAAARAAFRRLAGRWHPDRCAEPQAAEVFQHLLGLNKAAAARRRSGLWQYQPRGGPRADRPNPDRHAGADRIDQSHRRPFR